MSFLDSIDDPALNRIAVEIHHPSIYWGSYFGLMKLLDAITTYIGIRHVSLSEINPIMEKLMLHFGTGTGILLGSIIVVSFIIITIESGASYLETEIGEDIANLSRVLGYLVAGTITLLAVTNNIILILIQL